MRFGRPHMRGISTEMIADMHWAGDDAADDYGLTPGELVVALWFEASQGQPRFRKRWRQWLKMADPVLWKGDLDIELPPIRES